MRWQPAHRLFILLLPLLLAHVAAPPPASHAAPTSQTSALEVDLWLAPQRDPSSNVVEPNGLFNLDIRIENTGNVDVVDILLRFPYDRYQYLIADNRPLFQVTQTEFQVYVNQVRVQQVTNRRIVMRVRSNVRVPGQISMYSNFAWRDATGATSSGVSDREVLVVDILSNPSQPGVVVPVPPDGSPAPNQNVRPVTCMLGIARDRTGVRVTWGSKSDPPARSYDVQVRQIPDGTWRNWQQRSTAQSAWFGPLEGRQFGFRVRGRSQAGAEENWPPREQVVTFQPDFLLGSCP